MLIRLTPLLLTMSTNPFVHLHVHSEYSTLDSTVRTKELVAAAAKLEMPAVAMTDHGNLYAAVEFYQNLPSTRVLE